MKHIETMKLAMEALVKTDAEPGSKAWEREAEAITALRQALANEALDRMAENARELGLDYEPAQQDIPDLIAGTLGVSRGTAYDMMREALAEQPEQQEQDRQIDQLIQERDHRDEIIDKLCDAVLGPDRYEWSSQYFFEDAMREVQERIAALEKLAQQEPTCKQSLQVWVIPNSGQFSWEPQDERYWTRMEPAQRTWVGLTDEDKEFIAKRASVYDWHDYEVIEATEAKLKEKNNA